MTDTAEFGRRMAPTPEYISEHAKYGVHPRPFDQAAFERSTRQNNGVTGQLSQSAVDRHQAIGQHAQDEQLHAIQEQQKRAYAEHISGAAQQQHCGVATPYPYVGIPPSAQQSGQFLARPPPPSG